MKTPIRVVAVLFLYFLATFFGTAVAGETPFNFIDAVSVKTGAGKKVTIIGIGLRSKELSAWDLGSLGKLRLFTEGSIDQWRGRVSGARISSLYDAGVTSVLRLEHPLKSGITPYAEMGMGVHLISHVHINDRMLSTAFQFGEFLGAGVQFGSRKEYEVTAIVQHDSNASIKRPNSGLSYVGLVGTYRFR